MAGSLEFRISRQRSCVSTFFSAYQRWTSSLSSAVFCESLLWSIPHHSSVSSKVHFWMITICGDLSFCDCWIPPISLSRISFVQRILSTSLVIHYSEEEKTKMDRMALFIRHISISAGFSRMLESGKGSGIADNRMHQKNKWSEMTFPEYICKESHLLYNTESALILDEYRSLRTEFVLFPLLNEYSSCSWIEHRLGSCAASTWTRMMMHESINESEESKVLGSVHRWTWLKINTMDSD